MDLKRNKDRDHPKPRSYSTSDLQTGTMKNSTKIGYIVVIVYY